MTDLLTILGSKPHQSKLEPGSNKFHVGNGEDGKHYWITPPALYGDECHA